MNGLLGQLNISWTPFTRKHETRDPPSSSAQERRDRSLVHYRNQMQLGEVNNSASFLVISTLFKSLAVSFSGLTNSSTTTPSVQIPRRFAPENAFLTFQYIQFFQNPPRQEDPT